MNDEPDIKTEMLEDILLDFTNRDGKTIRLRDNMTIAELTEMGMRVTIGPVGAPTKPNQYVHVP